MNNEVSVEVDMLSRLPSATMLTLADSLKKADLWGKKYVATIKARSELFSELEAIDAITITFSLSDGDINLRFSGTGELLRRVWGLLRHAGWNTLQRPQKGDASFGAFWNHSDEEAFSRIYLHFSSSVCRRVQIGTQMVSQPIFETHCEELPMLEADGNLATALEAAP